jgi:hypothetical protein
MRGRQGEKTRKTKRILLKRAEHRRLAESGMSALPETKPSSKLEDVTWSRRPPLPPALFGFAGGMAVFIALALVARQRLSSEALNDMKVGWMILGTSLVGGGIAASRAFWKGRIVGRIRCEPGGLRVGEALLPYTSLRALRYQRIEAAQMSATATDTTLDVVSERGTLRLVAFDVAIDDLPAALARVERENPGALVAPIMPREWRRE